MRQILGLLGMYFNAAVTNSSLLFRLALTILWVLVLISILTGLGQKSGVVCIMFLCQNGPDITALAKLTKSTKSHLS